MPHTSIDAVRPPRKARLALLVASGAVALLGPGLLRAQTRPLHMVVWKSPSCGCCKEWIKLVESHGFRVAVHDVGNTAARARMKLPMKLGSCHTAVVGRYAVEGHVPAADVLRLVKEAPDAVGLAVPGMPVGSPGMDGPDYGDQRDPFDVLLVAKDGSTLDFGSYR
jgi:hypothetical protein